MTLLPDSPAAGCDIDLKISTHRPQCFTFTSCAQYNGPYAPQMDAVSLTRSSDRPDLSCSLQSIQIRVMLPVLGRLAYRKVFAVTSSWLAVPVGLPTDSWSLTACMFVYLATYGFIEQCMQEGLSMWGQSLPAVACLLGRCKAGVDTCNQPPTSSLVIDARLDHAAFRALDVISASSSACCLQRSADKYSRLPPVALVSNASAQRALPATLVSDASTQGPQPRIFVSNASAHKP